MITARTGGELRRTTCHELSLVDRSGAGVASRSSARARARLRPPRERRPVSGRPTGPRTTPMRTARPTATGTSRAVGAGTCSQKSTAARARSAGPLGWRRRALLRPSRSDGASEVAGLGGGRAGPAGGERRPARGVGERIGGDAAALGGEGPGVGGARRGTGRPASASRRLGGEGSAAGGTACGSGAPGVAASSTATLPESKLSQLTWTGDGDAAGSTARTTPFGASGANGSPHEPAEGGEVERPGAVGAPGRPRPSRGCSRTPAGPARRRSGPDPRGRWPGRRRPWPGRRPTLAPPAVASVAAASAPRPWRRRPGPGRSPRRRPCRPARRRRWRRWRRPARSAAWGRAGSGAGAGCPPAHPRRGPGAGSTNRPGPPHPGSPPPGRATRASWPAATARGRGRAEPPEDTRARAARHVRMIPVGHLRPKSGGSEP